MAMVCLHDVLIIGCGNIAGGFDAARSPDETPLTHAGAYTRHPQFRLSACVEPDETRRLAFMQRWGVAQGAATVADIRGHFDVISVCSPTALHEDHLQAALMLSPRLIFCEKPVTPTVTQTERLVRLCRDAGVMLAVAHNRRWDPAVQRLADELRSGRWGTLRSVVGTYNKGVLNNGSHLVDLLHRLLGPLELVAAGTPVHDFWPNDPSIPALLRTHAGVPVQLVTTHAADYAVFELVLHTSEATLAMDDGGQRWRIRRRQASGAFSGYQILDSGETVAGEVLQSTRLAIDNLHGALHDEAPLASTGDTALAAQRLCEMLHRAAAPTRSLEPALTP
jgi:predicted dehydrogenase